MEITIRTTVNVNPRLASGAVLDALKGDIEAHLSDLDYVVEVVDVEEE